MKKHFKDLFNKKEASFIIWFAVVFVGTAGLLAGLGLLPSELQEHSDGKTLSEELAEKAAGTVVPNSNGSNGSSYTVSNVAIPNTNSGTKNTYITGANAYPTHLSIPKIGLDTDVVFPKGTDTKTLDTALTQGPVYYPGSGTVNNGNMFIFGHSTGYKVVINKAYKVFNDIKTLSVGDTIFLQAGNKQFSYRVRSVDKVNKDQTLVEFDTTSHLLTLSTCNSFGAKTDRYVVVAEFVGQV